MKAFFGLILVLATLFFVPTQAVVYNTPNIIKSSYTEQKEIEGIDLELEALMNLRDYYASRVARYRARAMRYELQGDNLEDAKQLSLEADKIEGVVKQIDEEILRLEKKRSLLYKS